MLFDEINSYVEYYSDEESKQDKGLEAYLNMIFPDNSILLYNQLGLIKSNLTDKIEKTHYKTIKIPSMESTTHVIPDFKNFKVLNGDGEIIIEEDAKDIGIILSDNLQIEKTILTLANHKSTKLSSDIEDILNDNYADAVVVYNNLTGELTCNGIQGIDTYKIGDIDTTFEFGTYYIDIDGQRYQRKKFSKYPIYLYSKRR